MKITTLLLAAALAVSIHSAQAASGDWIGTTSGNWNVDSNWTGATYPQVLGDVATFNADVTNSTLSMNSAAIALTTIAFSTDAEAYIFNAGGGSLKTRAITINSSVGAVTQTFNLAVNIADATATMGNSSTSAILNLAGGVNNLDAAGTRQLSIAGVGTIYINALTQTGGGAMSLVKFDSGKLILTGTNTKTGVTKINDGILQINSVGALGTAEVQFAGGIIGLGAENFTRGLGSGINNIRWVAMTGDTGFAAYGADRTVNITGLSGGTFVWEATSSIKDGQALILGSADSTNKVTFQNGLGLADKARTILVNNGNSSANVDGEISGAISSTVAASGSLIKTGVGTLLLSGTNTYTGLTTVSVGTLLVGNSSGIGSLAGGATVASGAVLGGSGSIAGAVTIQSGGRLAPGNSPGLLAVNNDVTIADGGIFSVEVNGITAGTGYDRLVMTGAGSDFSLTGSNDLELTLGFTPAANALFFLVDNSGGSAISGIFESLNGVTTTLSQGSLFTVSGQGFNISYTGDLAGNTFTGGNDLVIQAIPEPTTWVLMGLGGLFLLTFRRRAGHAAPRLP